MLILFSCRTFSVLIDSSQLVVLAFGWKRSRDLLACHIDYLQLMRSKITRNASSSIDGTGLALPLFHLEHVFLWRDKIEIRSGTQISGQWTGFVSRSSLYSRNNCYHGQINRIISFIYAGNSFQGSRATSLYLISSFSRQCVKVVTHWTMEIPLYLFLSK